MTEKRFGDRFKAARKWLMDPGDRLAGRATNAGVWAFALSLVIKLIIAARTIALGRLLSPEDFGLMGIAMLAIELMNRFTQTGFKRALVQRPGAIEPYFDSAWTVEVLRGLLLGGVLIAAAPQVGVFFDSSAAVPLLMVMAIGVVANGLTNTWVVVFDRELQFRERFMYRSVPHVVDLVVSITAGIILRSAWALAIGWVAGRVAGTIASFWVSERRPRLAWDGARIKALFGFGIWLFASEILIYLTLNLDDIVVGRVVGTAALGLYQMAYTVSQLTTTELTTVANEVAFPTYSKVQGDPARLRRAYGSVLHLIALLSFPIAAGLWFLGAEAVHLVLGDQWSGMVPAFRVLIIWGLIRSLLATTGPLLSGIGRPDVATKIQAAQLVILATLIVPAASNWGIEGAAWATVIAAVFPDTAALVIASRAAGLELRRVASTLAFPAIHAAAMLGGLGAMGMALGTGALSLLWAPAVGGTIYFGLATVSHRWLGYAPDGLFGGIEMRHS